MSDSTFGWCLLAGPIIALVAFLGKVEYTGTGGLRNSAIGLLLVLGGLAALWVWRRLPGGSPGGAMGGKLVAMHVHGESGPDWQRKIAKHEAGHMVAAEYVGGHVKSAEVFPNGAGGIVWAWIPNPTVHKVGVFLRAGEEAMGSSTGADYDRDKTRQLVNTAPSKERSDLKSAIKRDARRAVNNNRGKLNRYAKHLETYGRK